MDKAEQARLERERKGYLATRTGRGRKRASIQKVFKPRDEGKSITGHGIVIRPQTFNRDSFRALVHFCKQHGISLVKLEVITAKERGVAHETVISWLAVGSRESLKLLRDHKYIGVGNWQFATTAQVSQNAKSMESDRGTHRGVPMGKEPPPLPCEQNPQPRSE